MSGIIEGLGISLFIPLINLTSGTTDTPWPVNVITKILSDIGLVQSTWLITLFIVTLLSLSFCVIYVQNILVARSKLKFQNQMRYMLIERLLESSWSYYNKQTTGNLINQLTVQVERAASCVNHSVLSLASFIQMFVYLSISFALSPELTIISLLMIAVMAFGSTIVTKNGSNFGKKSSLAHLEYSSKISEYIRGIKLIKVMHLNAITRDRVNILSDNIFTSYFNEDSSHALLSLYMRVFPVIIISAVIIVSFEILELSGAVVLAFLFILMRIVPSITSVRANYHSYNIYLKSLEIVDETIASALSEREMGLDKTVDIVFDQAIVIKNLSFSYPNSKYQALKNVSLSIPKNSTVGIVGASGSGKTTLLDIIVGLYIPDSGTIFVDEDNINEINIGSWRRNIGYVTQDVLMFNESLSDNLMTSRDKVESSEFSKVIMAAHLDKVIDKLPMGIDTNLGENGVRLSGGEKQRVALARAMMGGATFLLLDEATSALDAESESIVQSRIEEFSHKCTTVVITHRLATVKSADVIYVLDNGSLVEQGTFDALLAEKGVFYKMYQLQNKHHS